MLYCFSKTVFARLPCAEEVPVSIAAPKTTYLVW